MDTILKELIRLLGIVREQYDSQNGLQVTLDAREFEIIRKEADLAERIAGFAAREAAVVVYENLRAVQIQNSEMNQKLQDGLTELKEDRRKFELDKNIREQEIATEWTKIKREWAAIKGDSA